MDPEGGEPPDWELEQAGEPIGDSLLIPGSVDMRIPDSERNRPAAAPALARHPARAALVETLCAVDSDGLMSADEVADHVVREIRERRFYILTHADAAIDAVTAPLDWMRSGVQPPSNPVLEPWTAHA